MNTIRNFFLWLTAASAICAPSHLAAVPAYPGSRLVTQPDGSKIELHLLGDEYGHVTVNADGTPVEPGDNGYWRPSGKSTQEMLSMRRNKISRKRPTKKVPAFPRTGEVRSLIVLVEFPDVRFVTPDVHREFSEMLNLPGFDRREHIGCAADYFRTQSMGQFSPAFDVYGPVMADKAATYYGENDANGDDFRAYELVIELCRKLDNEINFADYDLDGDGQVDNIYFFYAGYGENFAGNKAAWIWPHANHIDLLGVPEAERTFDGKVINSYGCCAELYGSTGSDTSAIGTFCHEFGHILGLPDTYDVNYSVDGSANHPDKWDIMASGSYLPETRNCGAVPAGYTAVERWLLGWSEPVEIARPQSVTLPPLHSSALSARISTSDPDEFFILENRQKAAGSYDRYIPSHGLLVWHVDRRPDATISVTIGDERQTITCAQAWELEYNALNMNPTHQCLEIEKASGNDGSKSTLDTPFPGRQMRTRFTDETEPSMKSWNGQPTGKPVTNIRELDGNIHFDFMGGSDHEIKIKALAADNITDNSFTANWEASPDAVEGYRLRLYEAEREMQYDAISLDEIFTSIPENWSIDGSGEIRESALHLGGGTKASTLMSPAVDLSTGATLTIVSRQAAGSGAASALTVSIGDEFIYQYVPTDLSSEYTIELPERGQNSVISFSTERRKTVAIEQITLRQDMESIRLTILPAHTATVTTATSHSFTELTLNKTYAYTVEALGYAGSTSDAQFVTTGGTSAIETIENESEIPAEYFTVDGRHADAQHLHPGIYIVRKGSKTEKVLIK